MGVEIKVEDPKELERIRQKEMDITRDRINCLIKATGGQVLLTLGQLDGEERVDPSCLGQAEEVYEAAVGDNDHIFIQGCKASRATTILLRGATEFQLDEMERSMN